MAKLLKALAALSVVLAAGTAQSSLINLGDGTVKDTATNLIWLYDWSFDLNSNVSQGCDWQCDVDWAANLAAFGATDWALPSLDQYQTLWVNVGSSVAGLKSNFKNVQLNYWTSTEQPDSPSDFAWVFVTDSGVRDGDPKTRARNAVAVRSAEAVIPEPATLALALAALYGLAATRRRQAATPTA